jgi:hypothetical protein
MRQGMHCSVIRGIQDSTVECNTVMYGIVQYTWSAVMCTVTRHSAVGHSAEQYTTQHFRAHRSTTKYNTAY